MDVALPVATLVIGVALGMLADYLKDARQDARLRQGVRDARKDRYLEMKQASLLELSEIVEEVNLSRSKIQRLETKAESAKGNPDRLAQAQTELHNAYVDGLEPASRLRAVLARVADEELRNLVSEFRAAVTGKPFEIDEMIDRAGPVQARIGVLLAELADTE